MKKHPEFFEKLIALDKDNKYISINNNQEALDIFLEKHKKYKLAYLENNKTNKQKKDEITENNAKFLIEQFLSSTEPFYIKCNKFSIESIKDIKCNIYDEALKDLSRNILSKPELKNKIEQAEKEKLIKERNDLLKKFNYKLTTEGKEKMKDISKQIKLSYLEISEKQDLPIQHSFNQINSEQALLNDRINNNIENKNKILINNRNNEAYIRDKAKNRITGYYARDEIINYKENNNFKIEYEYDTGKGIIVIINNNDAQYQFCSITLELKISGINKFNKTKCNNNKKNLLIKWATYCKTKKKSLESSKSFIELLCEDTETNQIPNIKVPTIASLKDQCSNITALPQIKKVNKKLGGNTKKYKKQIKTRKHQYKKQIKTRKHQYKKQKKIRRY